jgi:pimeloyl-ACP methyl ester carboxylesterase
VGSETIEIAGVKLDVFGAGEGAPLLLLHGGSGFDPGDRVNALMARQHRIICPSHPGFGKSELPDWITSVDDIAHIHLALLDKLSLQQVDVVGFSLGGWVAAEMATMSPERFRKIVMVGPVGVKTGPSDRLDVPDIFALSEADLQKALYHDPGKMRVDPRSLSNEKLEVLFRNRESLALYVWEPYMHNPKLKHRLGRVTAPTLFVRGASDGLISDRYLNSYAKLVPNSRTTKIEAAGHMPHLEQPEKFAETVMAFLN